MLLIILWHPSFAVLYCCYLFPVFSLLIIASFAGWISAAFCVLIYHFGHSILALWSMCKMLSIFILYLWKRSISSNVPTIFVGDTGANPVQWTEIFTEQSLVSFCSFPNFFVIFVICTVYTILWVLFGVYI